MTKLAEYRGTHELLRNLVLRDLRGRYKRSVLGWTWSLINPLATILIYWVVFSSFLKVEPPTGDPSGLKSFVLFLVCGLLPYRFVAESMGASVESLLANSNLVKKVYFPRELLVVATVGALVVTFVIELGVFSVVLLVFGNMVLPWLPVVVVFVGLQTLFVFGVAMLLAVVAVYFRDMEHLMSIVLQLWFYATPIIYPISEARDALSDQPTLRWLYEANPMTRFLSIYRDLLYNVRGPKLSDVVAVVAATAVSLVVGSFVFWKLEPRLAEEL